MSISMRGLSFLIALFAFGLLTPALLRAQESGSYAPVGAWAVRHGIVRTTLVFAPDGRYRFQRTPGASGGLDQVIGKYQVQADLLILSPGDGSQEAYRWAIGPEKHTNLTVLYLTDSFGATEVFIPDPP